jgi:nucleoside-diphosphate-sugar epimerase
MTIAILGANGFIGSRAVELFHLRKRMKVKPVVRRPPSLVLCSRFSLDWAIADASCEEALAKAFQGCDVVLHAVRGDADVIAGTLDPVYRACQKAGVKRLVYLSSAAVHGQCPKPGTDEKSPLSDRQWSWYNNSKVMAERRLLELRQEGSVELVILRPTLVFGPRSERWTVRIARDLENKKAYLLGEGHGICNTLYVDNLINAIDLAATKPGIDREAFLIADHETVTWFDFYSKLAAGLGLSMEGVARILPAQAHRDPQERLQDFRSRRWAKSLLRLLPSAVKEPVKKIFFEEKESPGVPFVSREIELLQQSAWKCPIKKAKEMLGYEPPVLFEEGCRRSVEWLRWVKGLSSGF